MQNFSKEELEILFTKKYGENGPSREVWNKYYEEDVRFIDPTQEKLGLESYIKAQDALIKRCDDIYLEAHEIITNDKLAFIEWTMGLKILNKEFIYPGTTRLKFASNGKIKEHRDYFDFCGPTFRPVPILGQLIRWLYKGFVS